ncbi:MAG: 2-C-methyl-D-erythritol 2,4-cyclodiphosphate synthase [Phycisphaerae bacterium]|nr:2-C-methyl-D-erythritol 2,4-cyclodiphosphate synthase [Phycisphaerae bacterium]
MIDRIGHGYDLHRLGPGRKMILAGIEIPFPEGLVGHSDADVVFHAVIDAMLGAAGLGDIGEQFPDNDPAFKDIDSSLLLERALKKVADQGYAPVNVDLTLIAERPKLSPYKSAMRANLAKRVGLAVDAVSVKAKTNEGLGETGRGEAIICHAIVGLAKRNNK